MVLLRLATVSIAGFFEILRLSSKIADYRWAVYGRERVRAFTVLVEEVLSKLQPGERR